MKSKISIDVDTEPLDDAIEKAKRLVELLQEATQIVKSLQEWLT